MRPVLRKDRHICKVNGKKLALPKSLSYEELVTRAGYRDQPMVAVRWRGPDGRVYAHTVTPGMHLITQQQMYIDIAYTGAA